MASKITDAWQFIGQALTEYGATLAPAARAGFVALAQAHCDALQPAIEAAHADLLKPKRAAKKNAPPPVVETPAIDAPNQIGAP